MTNADRIRAMTDEELAEFLSDNTNCDCCNIQCPDKEHCPSMSSCYCRWEEWLQSESLEEKCTNCHWYWRNNDTENECKGSDSVCHEFIPKK